MRVSLHPGGFCLVIAILFCNNLPLTTSSLDGLDPPPPFSGKDVTPILFSGSANEEFFPAAFGDFNADKLTDVFAVARNRTEFSIFLAHEEEPLLQEAINCKIVTRFEKQAVNIQGITVGDFNGDGMMDVMVTFVQPGTHDIVEVQIFKGSIQNLDCSQPLTPGIELVQEPLMVDIDGDMTMDLVGERLVPDHHGNDNKEQSTTTARTSSATLSPKVLRREKAVWKFKKGEKIEYEVYSFNIKTELAMPFRAQYDPSKVVIIKPSSNAIVDINGDTVPELVLITSLSTANRSHPFYYVEQYRINGAGEDKTWNFDLISVLPLDPDPAGAIQIIGQSLFVDLNQDGKLEHLIPYCSDAKCHKSGILVLNDTNPNPDPSSVLKLDVIFKKGGKEWTYLLNNGTTRDTFYTKTITLRVGDYNMDGFPDLIGVLMTQETWTEASYRAVIFENVPCEAAPGNGPCNFPRTFRLDFESLASYTNVSMATFYDIYEDGLLDVLLVRRTQDVRKHQKEKFSAFGFQSHPDYDANFLKVVVTTGIPCPTCPLAGIPYGNVIPGPVVRYITVTQVGDTQQAVAAQLYRSSHIPLDLPYIFFGIGHSPNFIETLDVSVSPRRDASRSHEWTQLIPNSQIIIIPSPPEKEWEWKAKIFLPSNKTAIHTFGVLMGFVAGIVLLVLFLHWKERREDRQERLLESRRFHMM